MEQLAGVTAASPGTFCLDSAFLAVQPGASG